MLYGGQEILICTYWGKYPTVHVILLPHLWMCSLTLLEIVLSVIVTHFKRLINVPRYTSSSLSFAMNATDHINVVFCKFAYSLRSRIIASVITPLLLIVMSLPLSIAMHIISLHRWIRGRVCYMIVLDWSPIALFFNMSMCDELPWN